MRMPIIKVELLSPNAICPTRAHTTSAGFDVYPLNEEPLVVNAGESVLVHTGIKVAIPNGYCLQVNPRSGLGSKHKIVVGARVIDSDYRGELMINLHNNGTQPFEYSCSKAVAQLLVLPIIGQMSVVEQITDTTARGEGGFGSTDKDQPKGEGAAFKYAELLGSPKTSSIEWFIELARQAEAKGTIEHFKGQLLKILLSEEIEPALVASWVEADISPDMLKQDIIEPLNNILNY